MEQKKKNISRRDIIKGLAGLPVLGAFGYGFYHDRKHKNVLNSSLLKDLGIDLNAHIPVGEVVDGQTIRVGIVGSGGRGMYLMRAAGFAEPAYIDNLTEGAQSNPKDDRLEVFRAQDNLNLRITAVCDLFDVHAEKGIRAGANLYREGTNGKMTEPPKRYKTYQELIRAEDVDAVIVATADHWHGPVTIEAAKAGKHVYCEKPLTWKVPETYEVRKVVKESGIFFQLGHQGRQTESYIRAEEAIKKGVLGKINLIEICTNRNSPNGAWVYPLHKKANEKTIDWQQFIANTTPHPFSMERFFRWRCWWDYSTGISGDLLTHEYDAINQIMQLGIPHSATSTGGVYFYKDGRTVPDVLTTVFEFPERDLSLLYSASLSSEKQRGKILMGHDAYMEMGNELFIYADINSTRYKEKIKNGEIDLKHPIYAYIPGRGDVDVVSSATEKYFAGRGLLHTYRDGKRVDTTHLHIKEWINGIRKGVQPSCDIDQAFEEAITAHMGTLAYKKKRTIFWDKEKETIA